MKLHLFLAIYRGELFASLFDAWKKGKNMLLNGGVSWRFRNNVAPWQFYVCDLFGMAVSSGDPNSRVVGDLPRSGIKRSRIESPGCFLFMLFLFVFLVRIFLGKAT